MKTFKERMNLSNKLILAVALLCGCGASTLSAKTVVYPGPDGEPRSEKYTVTVAGQDVFGYTGRAYTAKNFTGRFCGLPTTPVTFGYFDTDEEVEVSVRVAGVDVKSATVRPLSRGIKATVVDGEIRFKVREQCQLTIEPNGITDHVLHLFVNGLETEVPDPNDENVLYFPPGIHEVETIDLKDNQTLYIAGGAVVYSVVGENETKIRDEHRRAPRLGPIVLERYDHSIKVHDAKNVKILGRGIFCQGRLDQHPDDPKRFSRKSPIHVARSKDVVIDGIILRDATCWNVSLYRSQNLLVNNIKEISAGYNSDGINTISSQDVVIRGCFMRQRDDAVVIKAMDSGNLDLFLADPESLKELPGGEVRNVLVENCTIWSDWGYSFGVTYEIRKPVSDVVFRNNDVVHATTTKQGVLGVLVSDQETVSNVLFEDIRVERSLKPLISLDIFQTKWSVSDVMGSIRNVVFRDITLVEHDQMVTVNNQAGPEDGSVISHIVFDNVVLNGKKLTEGDARINYVSGEIVNPVFK